MKKILAIILALTMILSFTACGGEENAKKAVDKALTAIKNFDQEGMERYLLNGKIDESTLQATGAEEAKAIFSTFSWKITSCEEEGEKATASVDLTCVSLAGIMVDLSAEMMEKAMDGTLSLEDSNEYVATRMGEMIKDPKAKTNTQNVEFVLEKVDGQWKLTNPEVVTTVMIAGLEGFFGSDEK